MSELVHRRSEQGIVHLAIRSEGQVQVGVRAERVIGLVQEIEALGAKLEPLVLFEIEALEQRYIAVEEPGPERFRLDDRPIAELP